MPTRRHIPLALFALFALFASLLSPPPAAAEGLPADFGVQVVDDHTLVFQRTRTGTDGVEGFVVDSNALVETLTARVLEARALGSVARIARVDATRRTEPAHLPQSTTGYDFLHRFSAPFSSIETRMQLEPLEDPSEGALVDELVLVLAICVIAGLYALYRMTATQLVFAERSRNFVSAVSHELKTPLTAIRMYAEMLAENLVESDERRSQYYRTITKESERLTRLIENVLSLSRLEQRRELTLRLGDVRPHLRDAVEVLRPHAESQGCALELTCDEALPQVKFEPDAIKQVLFNLVDNCIKYGRDSTDKRILIACKSSGTGAHLTVRDFGPGVVQSHIQRIFLPFFRGERELTRKHPGTGIGLALVKGLVLAMHGHVSAENLRPGFCVTVELVGTPP